LNTALAQNRSFFSSPSPPPPQKIYNMAHGVKIASLRSSAAPTFTLLSLLLLSIYRLHQKMMIIITTAAIAFTLFSLFVIYACAIADPDTSNVGRFCTKELPSFLYQQLEKTVGKKVLSHLNTLVDRAFQLVYLTVVLGSWSIMFCYGYEEIEKSNYISTYHQYSGYVVFLMCMSSFHCACNTPPGSVTARSMPLFDHYAYDDVLYKKQTCPTLKIRKISRSKYDRFTRRHVVSCSCLEFRTSHVFIHLISCTNLSLIASV